MKDSPKRIDVSPQDMRPNDMEGRPITIDQFQKRLRRRMQDVGYASIENGPERDGGRDPYALGLAMYQWKIVLHCDTSRNQIRSRP